MTRFARVITEDHGGSVVVYAARIRAARGATLLDGRIVSAGTMWLSRKDTWVTPRARLGFHEPKRDVTGLARLLYLSFLPRKLRTWFRANVDGRDFVWLTGQELHDKFGVPLCAP